MALLLGDEHFVRFAGRQTGVRGANRQLGMRLDHWPGLRIYLTAVIVTILDAGDGFPRQVVPRLGLLLNILEV